MPAAGRLSDGARAALRWIGGALILVGFALTLTFVAAIIGLSLILIGVGLSWLGRKPKFRGGG